MMVHTPAKKQCTEPDHQVDTTHHNKWYLIFKLIKMYKLYYQHWAL